MASPQYPCLALAEIKGDKFYMFDEVSKYYFK